MTHVALPSLDSPCIPHAPRGHNLADVRHGLAEV